MPFDSEVGRGAWSGIYLYRCRSKHWAWSDWGQGELTGRARAAGTRKGSVFGNPPGTLDEQDPWD